MYPELQIGPFQIETLLGQGAMGSVWKARHLDDDIIVAIKFLLEEKSDEWMRSQFENEIQAVAGLNHRNICQVLDHGRFLAPNSNKHYPYLVMEYIDGPAMFDLTGRISWIPLRRLILQLLDALAHAHARGFLHHDIKPSNVMLRRKDGLAWTEDSIFEPLEVVLMDFGLARPQGEISQNNYIQGTPAYMPPEQLKGAQNQYGPWSDLYSLGCSLWRLLTGSPPHGSGRKLRDYLFASEHVSLPPLQNQVSIPTKLEDWLHIILNKNPRTRFQMAADAARELRQLRNADRMPYEPIIYEDDKTASFKRTYTPSPIQDVTFSGARTFVPIPTDWRRRYPPKKPIQLKGVGLNLFALRRIPIMGRIEERDKLWQTLRDVQQKGTMLTSLTGVEGIGKTCLAEWLGERGEEFGCCIRIQIECEYNIRIEHIKPMMRAMLGIEGLTQEEASSHLFNQVHPSESIFTSIPELIPLLHPKNNHPLDFSSDTFFSLWLDFLEHISYKDPKRCRVIILHIEKIMKAPKLFDFCERMLKSSRSRRLPILIVLPIRSEQITKSSKQRLQLAKLHQNANAIRISVNRLSVDEETDLIERSLGLSPTLTKEITRKTKGIPYLSIQIITELVIKKTLVIGKEGFVLAADNTLQIPEWAQRSWDKRLYDILDGSSENEINAIQLAALIGEHVQLDLWRRCLKTLGLPYPIRLLTQLVNRRLLLKWKGGRGFSFEHPIFIETLVSDLSESKRIEYHKECAEGIKSTDNPKVRESIAYHLKLSNQWERAFEQYTWCFTYYVRQSDQEGLTRNYERMKILIESTAIPKEHESNGFWILHQMVYYRRKGDWEAFLKLNQVFDKEDNIKWPNANAYRAGILGWYYINQGKVQKAAIEFQKGISILSCTTKKLSPIQRSIHRKNHMGLFEAYNLLDHSDKLGKILNDTRELFSKNEDKDHFLTYLHRASSYYRSKKEIKKAKQLEEKALEIATEYGQILHLAIGHNNLGDMEKEAGNYIVAKEHFYRSYRLFRQLGNVYALMSLYNIGATLVKEEQYQESREIFQKVLQKSSQNEYQLVSIFSHFQMLIVMASLKDNIGWEIHTQQLQDLLKENALFNNELSVIIEQAYTMATQWSAKHADNFQSLLKEWLTISHPLIQKLNNL